MEKSEPFNFLDDSYFSFSSKVEQEILENEIRKLLHMKSRKPHEMIEGRALLEMEGSFTNVCDQIRIFRKTFITEFEDGFFERTKNDLDGLLSVRTLEEWCCFYLEVYLWKNSQGRVEFATNIKKIFNKSIRLFYNTSEQLFESKRKFRPEKAQSRLEELLHYLNMNRVDHRLKKQKFLTLLSHYKPKMKQEPYDWMNKQLFDKKEWNPFWYIFDRPLFAHDLLNIYDRTAPKKIALLHNQSDIVDCIFAIVINYLMDDSFRSISGLDLSHEIKQNFTIQLE